MSADRYAVHFSAQQLAELFGLLHARAGQCLRTAEEQEQYASTTQHPEMRQRAQDSARYWRHKAAICEGLRAAAGDGAKVPCINLLPKKLHRLAGAA